MKPRHASTPSYGTAALGELQRELGQSVRQVQSLTTAVKGDILRLRHDGFSIQDSVKARVFMKRWALEKLFRVAERVQWSMVLGLARWRAFVTSCATPSGARLLVAAAPALAPLNGWQRRQVRARFETWTVRLHEARQAEEDQRREAAALDQCAFRQRVGPRRWGGVRATAVVRRMHRAATHLQAL